jgi:hypothetical protein
MWLRSKNQRNTKSRTSKPSDPRRTGASVLCELLENRTLLSNWTVPDNGNHTINLQHSAGGTDIYLGTAYQTTISGSLTIIGGTGDDKLVDAMSESDKPAGGILFNGGGGTDTLEVHNASGDHNILAQGDKV